VKFFDPATIVFFGERQPASVATAPPRSVKASLLVKVAAISLSEMGPSL